ncbi:MAG TPA: non-heme iron oxygenase ferredoxin subunit [Gemmataceae bacterium]|jgi:nitrite reductase (NADH) small subunit/3-phenylpropionate/trans-cinnamate dioxygenase ferredoxin subunit
MAFVKVATVQEVPPGTAKQVQVNGRTLAVFNVNSSFHVLDDTCPHRGGPLSEGDLEGQEVICPWHGARFDVTSGAHLSPPARSDVACYQVQVVGDEVQVDLPG